MNHLQVQSERAPKMRTDGQDRVSVLGTIDPAHQSLAVRGCRCYAAQLVVSVLGPLWSPHLIPSPCGPHQ